MIVNAVNMKLFGKANDSRFLTELKSILSEENPLPAIERLAEFDLFQFLWPDLKPHYKIDRRFMHVLVQSQLAISWFRLLYLEESCQNWMVYLLAETAKISEFLLDQKDRADQAAHQLARESHLKNSRIVMLLAEIRIEGLLYIMAIARKNHVKKAVSLYVTTLQQVEPALSGDDLIKMGYQPGPRFKKILTFLKNARLDNLVCDKKEEVALLRRNFPPAAT
jgi:tRNA nucleotidyltransferase (CCA-adding enzyme)